MPETKDVTDPPSKPAGLRPGRASLVLATLVAAVAAMLSFWQNGRHPDEPHSAASEESTFMPKVTKTDAQWRQQLTPEQYEVTRNKGTERAFTGAFWNHKESGDYKCIGCGAELFTSQTKYDSGCGWPSFFAADHAENVHAEEDRSHGMIRTEVMCNNCGAHLGHVFDDGPQPTGQRYCINSAALEFEKTEGADASPDKGK